MATDEATVTETEFDDGTKTLGDKLVGLTLLEAKSLADYLKEVHGIEPAGGGVVMAMGPGGGDGGGCGCGLSFSLIHEKTTIGDL